MNAAADFETNLERIITQKWIAIFPLGTEAWTEHRRTGYPRLLPAVVDNSGGAVNVALAHAVCLIRSKSTPRTRRTCKPPFPH